MPLHTKTFDKNLDKTETTKVAYGRTAFNEAVSLRLEATERILSRKR